MANDDRIEFILDTLDLIDMMVQNLRETALRLDQVEFSEFTKEETEALLNGPTPY